MSNILLHIIFSTKNRAPLIPGVKACDLHRYLAAIARDHQCLAHEIGGTDNHVHVCCCLYRDLTCAQLVKQIKTGSSKWMKAQGAAAAESSWQAGYGVFSVGRSQLAALKEYIREQPKHHARFSFEEEYRDLLRRQNVGYDERYVWD